ncbi:MAG: glycoside hydrolase family 3 C-terminal domain-containing protein [Caldilineaceae bacterium]
MTLEEKAALCTGLGPWSTTPVERLGIPPIIMTDGPHGIRRSGDINAMAADSLPATCFPTASCMASSWDVELLTAVGQAIAEEAIALGVDLVLGPSNNMKRSPLCGRNFEYFAEDPYLSGELATSYIKGVQGKGVGTSLKHYAVNNQETRRFSISAEVDERTLHEIYLPAFEKAVKEAQPWSVMCAYNRVNGEFCSEHHQLLTKILKEEWGFEGFVVSDWGAVHDRVAALTAGLDLEMPGPKDRRVQAVIEAVRSGKLDEAVLDEAVRRILRIAFMAAETDKGGSFDIDAHHALARKAASEGMVLLKNNGILPLQGQQQIAVIGRAAREAHYQGGGSSHIHATQVDVPFVELQKVNEAVELIYAEGYTTDGALQQSLIDEATTIAQNADAAILYISLPSSKESEGYDRPDLDLMPQQIALIKAVSAVQPATIVIINSGSAVTMSDWIDSPAAVLQGWMMGQAGGGAIADILWGKTNPSGKLAETFPNKLADTPSHINFPGSATQVHYGEGIYIGYRYYDAKQMPVLFPFGHGLSYTTFAYGAPRVSATSFKDIDGVTVSVDITNTGALAGKEIVQLYVHDQKSQLARPPKELKGFAKVELLPGETKTVSFALDFRSFAYYHPGHHQWICEDGDFDLLVGASAADIRGAVTVTLQATQDLPSLLNRDSTVRDWLEDKRGNAVFAPMFQQMIAQMSAAFGVGVSQEAGIGMDMMGFVMETPLLSLLHFQEAMLPVSPEDLVDGLLAQVAAL